MHLLQVSVKRDYLVETLMEIATRLKDIDQLLESVVALYIGMEKYLKS